MNWNKLINYAVLYRKGAPSKTRKSLRPKWFKLKGYVASVFEPEVCKYLTKAEYKTLEEIEAKQQRQIDEPNKTLIHEIKDRVMDRYLSAKFIREQRQQQGPKTNSVILRKKKR